MPRDNAEAKHLFTPTTCRAGSHCLASAGRGRGSEFNRDTCFSKRNGIPPVCRLEEGYTCAIIRAGPRVSMIFTDGNMFKDPRISLRMHLAPRSINAAPYLVCKPLRPLRFVSAIATTITFPTTRMTYNIPHMLGVLRSVLAVVRDTGDASKAENHLSYHLCRVVVCGYGAKSGVYRGCLRWTSAEGNA